MPPAKPRPAGAPVRISDITNPPSLRTQKGRPPVVYSVELALAVCARIADGETLIAVCRDDGMPTKATFSRWVVAYPEVGRAYAAAREMSAYSLEEDALELGRHLITAPENSNKVRAFDILMNQLRWSAARRNPRVFSEKGAIQITVPVQINTTLDMATGAENTAEFPEIFSLDMQAVITTESETVPVESADRVEMMGDTSIAPLDPKLAPDRNAKRKTRAELRKEHFAKHGARGTARRKDIIQGDDK
jgi:hypothetical protein